MDKIKIGIVIADTDEYRPLQEKMGRLGGNNTKIAGRTAHKFCIGNAEVISVLCGIGKVNAAVSATALAEQGTEIIFNCGLSGGVSGISKNEITVPDKFLEHDFDLTGIGYKPCEKPGQEYIYSADGNLSLALMSKFENAKRGTAVSGDGFVQNEELRSYLRDEFSAMSCDMETAAIAYVCASYGIKFASLRKISDDAGSDAAESYREINALAEDVLINAILSVIADIGQFSIKSI